MTEPEGYQSASDGANAYEDNDIFTSGRSLLQLAESALRPNSGPSWRDKLVTIETKRLVRMIINTIILQDDLYS